MEIKNNKKIFNCDVLIIGAGPAGLTAAIYAARDKLQTIIIESNIYGGQVATTYHIANYPGVNGVISGYELMENIKNQALSFGAVIKEPEQILEIDLKSNPKKVITNDAEYFSKAVIITTGSEPRKLPVPEEEKFRGRGIHYCATCDAAFYKDMDVIVVGGGTSALEEAVYLTKFARSVTIVNRSDKFKAAKKTCDTVKNNGSIKIIWNTIVKEVKGEEFVESVILQNKKTGEIREEKTDGIFVYIGTEPNTSIFKDQINLSETGHIIADENMATNIPGVFAAGDVREKQIRQITTAVSDGTIAGIMAEKFINSYQ